MALGNLATQEADMDQRHRPSWWNHAELIVRLAVMLAGAGKTVAQMIKILSHIG